jgi:hypothetical protein
MDGWDDGDEQAREPHIGRPRPEPPDLVMARQLVSAYTLARTPDDRSYAAEEAETYVDLHGDELSEAALATFLDLPATESTLLVLDAVANALADRAAGAPTVVGRLLRLSIARSEPARANAEVVLGRISAAHLAAGLIAVLADPECGVRLKGSAAAAVVALGLPAAAQILDALAEPEPRAWIVEASGCSAAAGDAEVMRRIAARPAEH